jgi:hypothetical protein
MKNWAVVATKGHMSRRPSPGRQTRKLGVQQVGCSPYGKATKNLEVKHLSHARHEHAGDISVCGGLPATAPCLPVPRLPSHLRRRFLGLRRLPSHKETSILFFAPAQRQLTILLRWAVVTYPYLGAAFPVSCIATCPNPNPRLTLSSPK